MQTFLPLPTYADSLKTLDQRRLGNQVYREAFTLIRGGWPNHPASKMWKGHFHHLALYILAGLDELKHRGKDYPHHYVEVDRHLNHYPDTGPPCWLGDPAFHASHRSNLLRKNYEWYGQFGWSEPIDLPYVWPLPVQIVPSFQKPQTITFGRKINV